ncbi:hypothetical protein ADEAN_000143600 [Angomonas deanei]|uniref:Uncharacterized protein n=1 Tax=Angomonas deanei TaxID=59799 RepID=A0A7G2C7N1_9TRYP|nr:hypothetical protein ADEAN_000143600 [Angomonas deanei]
MPKKKKKASVRNDSLSSMNTFVRHDSPDDNSNSSDDTSSVPLNRETTSPEFIRGEIREWSQDPPEDTANTATPRRQNERSNSSNSAVAAPQLTKPPLPHPPRGSGKSTPKRFQSPGSISSDFPCSPPEDDDGQLPGLSARRPGGTGDGVPGEGGGGLLAAVQPGAAGRADSPHDSHQRRTAV